MYYTSSPYEFHAAYMGYLDKLKDSNLGLRYHAEIMYRINGGKGSFNKIWPANDNKEVQEKMTIDKDLYEKIKKIHNIK